MNIITNMPEKPKIPILHISDLHSGDVLRHIKEDTYYLVCRDGHSNPLKLHSISGGNIWATNSLFGSAHIEHDVNATKTFELVTNKVDFVINK